MEFKDYYKIMGVAADASTDEIKRTYRKLARKYHPDVSKETNAEEQFKSVNEAYEVLKDPEKRAGYDQLYKGGWRAGQEFTPPPNWQQQHHRQSQHFGGENFSQTDSQAFSDFFSSLFGQQGGFEFSRSARGRARMKGEDLHYTLPVTLEESYQGATRAIQIDHHTLNVKIPPGVIEGQKIRLREQGNPGLNGGPQGDLYLEIKLVPHPFYHVEKRDIILNLPVTPWEAALGAAIKVPSLGGKIEVKIPPNSQTGTKLRLKGRGLSGNVSGDQYILLQVVVPKADTEVAKKLYQEMAEKMAFNPREKLGV